MLKSKYLWIILLLGIILPVLFYFGYFLWELKKFNDSFKPFDETELLKTHYQGVDCSSLVGHISFGDYGISAQSACAGERAWYENNVELCKLYDFNSFPDACITWIAVKTGNLRICEMNDKSISFPNNKLPEKEWKNYLVYNCYEYAAKYRDEPKVCDSIPYMYEADKQQCVEDATDGETYLQFTDSPIRPYCLEYNSDGVCVW
jgi:hypothetical protein